MSSNTAMRNPLSAAWRNSWRREIGQFELIEEGVEGKDAVIGAVRRHTAGLEEYRMRIVTSGRDLYVPPEEDDADDRVQQIRSYTFRKGVLREVRYIVKAPGTAQSATEGYKRMASNLGEPAEYDAGAGGVGARWELGRWVVSSGWTIYTRGLHEISGTNTISVFLPASKDVSTRPSEPGLELSPTQERFLKMLLGVSPSEVYGLRSASGLLSEMLSSEDFTVSIEGCRRGLAELGVPPGVDVVRRYEVEDAKLVAVGITIVFPEGHTEQITHDDVIGRITELWGKPVDDVAAGRDVASSDKTARYYAWYTDRYRIAAWSGPTKDYAGQTRIWIWLYPY